MHLRLGQSLIVKLDQSNYLMRRNQILHVVIANGFKEILDGSKPYPEKNNETIVGHLSLNPDYALWNRHNRLRQGHGVTTSIVENKEVESWNVGLCSENHNICDYLRAIGENVTNDDQIMAILGGLGPKYNPIVASVSFESLSLETLETQIKCTEFDGGGEFSIFVELTKQLGIMHRFACPYTPEQNGTRERKNHHVVEIGLSLLSTTHMLMRPLSQSFDANDFAVTLPAPFVPSPTLANNESSIDTNIH
ncbi:hypothetical protein L6164_028393 [Bauhinia variegata]|uniref:Uncharacterized protein n=1 Tax=Bauhinia variegata TaxID=167791 RepID=A0ACB9L6Q4_BAUVA|nr:hypothetical protein L6164_028393 [Bauhinia variegata]